MSSPLAALPSDFHKFSQGLMLDFDLSSARTHSNLSEKRL